MSSHFDHTARKTQSRWMRVNVIEDGSVKTFVYKERSESKRGVLSGFLSWVEPSSASEIKKELK
jgi:hypothetical protein